MARFPDPLVFREPQEWALVLELLKFDAVIAEVEEELLPNRLCGYLFELSQVFNRFYDQVPVLRAEEPARGSRLAVQSYGRNSQAGDGVTGNSNVGSFVNRE